MLARLNKYQIATIIAIILHAVGLIGILYGNNDFFAKATPINLLIMFGLLIWTQAEKNIQFFLFALIVIIAGIAIEVFAVDTGLLFGKYTYGKVLGYQIKSVPLLIGINWFVIIYCSAILVNTILIRAVRRIAAETGAAPMRLKKMSVIVDGATLAVFFDWIMEPVAVKLGYWQWIENDIPLFNYACWFFVSMLFIAVFQIFKFSRHNKFAVHLLLIQLMFFLLLRTFL